MEELDFEVDSLDSIPDNVRPLYKEHGGKFRLAVRGIDPADELKNALNREREERKSAKQQADAAKQQADELRKALEAKELAELEGNKKFEELYKREQETRSKTAAELEMLRKSIAERELSEAAMQIASGLTRDTARAQLAKKEAMAFAVHTPEGVKFSVDGAEVTAEQLQQHLAKQYPFLADGVQSSGGGASGGSNRASTGNFGGTRAERAAAIKNRFNLPE